MSVDVKLSETSLTLSEGTLGGDWPLPREPPPPPPPPHPDNTVPVISQSMVRKPVEDFMLFKLRFAEIPTYGQLKFNYVRSFSNGCDGCRLFVIPKR
jgi:hypothetical protein